MSVLSACSVSIDGQGYLNVSPNFELEQFFDGRVKAWGIVQDRRDAVVQRFIVDIDGCIDNENLVLNEVFEYGVGEGPLTRVWTIKPHPTGSFIGNAAILQVTPRVSHTLMRLITVMK